ncbi:Pseudouridylate synthase, 23S rRNA-or tRNA-specific [Nannocystis exedens]|uniref:Pseudouridylate synthase, 23S rRNA-or tRNA-specific n=1 Tax=Nannocystis exedens TaxID=54 RepID=A0A1I1X490_9BACT|nr:pseudouridine synthase [Nannocystis exedens]PCC70851.1 pseudouridine synthase protein [Nannocystis exedens]SFE01438.1 Pseudouridylate synthase, 23S rRNA-or tRNA-specific [Nannocystis exedens]
MNRSDEPTQPGPALHAAGRVRVRVISMEDGMTLRQLLGRRLGLAVAPASDLIRAGGVYIGNVRTCIPTLRVREGERVTIFCNAASVEPLDPDSLVVVHRDAHCVIVDKPHGVPAAATREGSRGAVSHALVQLLAREGVLRPYVGLVHALDPGAAGLALFTARGQDRSSFLAKFSELDMLRVYRARLSGHVPEGMSCETPLVKTSAGFRLARPDEREAVAARTEFRPLAASDGATLVEVELRRGPTEQISLHAQALERPVVGRAGAGEVLELACVRLAFTHPMTGVAVDVRAELPPWADPGAN